MIAGCGTAEDEYLPDAPLEKVSISHVEDPREFNQNFFLVIKEQEELEEIEEVLTSAEREEGTPDMPEPDYDMEVTQEDGEQLEYSLWLEEDSGSLVH